MMRTCLLLSGFLWLSAPTGIVSAAHVNVIELDNQIISPVTQQYILDALKRSEREGASCLVLTLDTPGGLLESTRAIVKAMMNARVPIVVYVGPSGARAGSAGVFLTLAGHIAAMAPSTNIGAAHPVLVGEGGGPVKKLIRRIKGGEEVVEEESHDPMSDKIINDTVAWITTIAKARHRNHEWAARAVTESVSVSEDVALKEKIIDLVAKDLPELLQKIDGWPVSTAAGQATLATAQAVIVQLPMTARQKFLAVVTNPSIAYLLMLLGTLGLIFEFTHPGIGFPGIAGLICVILAMFAFQTLPINYAALALIALGVILLVAEVNVVSHGLLALGGVIALTLGSLMLVDTPEPTLRVAPAVILPTVITLSGLVLFVVQRALSAQAQPVTTGAQGLIGEVGVASTPLNPEGTVFVHGETWSARSAAPVKSGERVRVVRVQGLQLTVERV